MKRFPLTGWRAKSFRGQQNYFPGFVEQAAWIRVKNSNTCSPGNGGHAFWCWEYLADALQQNTAWNGEQKELLSEGLVGSRCLHGSLEGGKKNLLIQMVLDAWLFNKPHLVQNKTYIWTKETSLFPRGVEGVPYDSSQGCKTIANKAAFQSSCIQQRANLYHKTVLILLLLFKDTEQKCTISEYYFQ